MAEAPKYRRRPLRLPDVPSVDFVSTGRAQQQAIGSIVNALDRMADFAFEYQKEEAIDYGVENAPDTAQINKAMESGTALDIPRGEIAQAAAAEVVKYRMEQQVSTKVRLLDADPETQNLSVQDYAKRVNSIINGYGSVLDDNIGKETGQVFRAKMATIYNSSLLAFSNKRIKRQLEQDRADNFEQARSIMDTFSTIVTDGVSVQNPIDGQVTTQLDIIDQQIASISQLPHLTATERKGLLTEAENRKAAVIQQRVGEWILEQPTSHVAQVLTNKVEDPNIAVLLNGLQPDERRDVILGAAAQIEENEAIEKKMADAAERKQKIAADKHSELAMQAYLANDVEERDAQIAALRDIDIDAANKLEAGLMKEGGQDNPDVINGLLIKSAQGTITLDDVVNARGDMSTATFKDFISRVDARRNDDHNIALDMARATLGINKSALTTDPEKGARMARAENELNLAAKADPTINRIDWMQNYIDNVLSGEAEKARKEARAGIDAAKKEAKVETDEEFIQYVQTRINNKQYYNRQMNRLRTLGLVQD